MLSRLIIFLLVISTAQFFSQVQDSIEVDANVRISDSMAVDTSFAFKDSSKHEITEKKKFIFQKPFSDQSYFITKDDILRNDYRYTGDLLKRFPFTFERSYGFIGQPNDIYLYGEQSNSTNYFIDGMPLISAELFGMLDFNHIQSEDIDSIEIVPLPRGFLYGVYSRPVSANFISKDILHAEPYSRIKYYEGPFGEAFIDGIFSMKLFKDLIASVDISNRKVDDSYKNSAFSIWQAKAKLRYNLSEKINFIGSYYFSKSNTGINGGVNVDKIRETTTDINSTLYNETLAPVYYEKNSLDFKQHNFGLKILAEPFNNTFTDLNIYYKFSLEEYQQIFSGYNSKAALKDKIFGISLDQKIQLDNLHFSLMSGYQILKDNPTFISSDPIDPTYYLISPPTETKSFFISSQVKMTLLNNKLVPSVYGKLVRKGIKYFSSEIRTSESIGGFGSDLLFRVDDGLNIYVGYSKYDDIIYQTTINLLEARITYSGENHNTVLIAFNKKLKSINSSGITFRGYYKFWKILFEGKFSQYFYEQGDTYEYFNLPKSNASLGVFVRDTFFNSNLDLKAGLQALYIGNQNLDFLLIPYKRFESADVPSSFTIDFTVSSEIHKTAIVYFTWENLLNKKYYITPYYPMLQRNIRFGVAWEIFN